MNQNHSTEFLILYFQKYTKGLTTSVSTETDFV